MEALDSQEDCKHSNKNKQMSIGRKKFNMDPKKGKFSLLCAIRREFVSICVFNLCHRSVQTPSANYN